MPSFRAAVALAFSSRKAWSCTTIYALRVDFSSNFSFAYLKISIDSKASASCLRRRNASLCCCLRQWRAKWPGFHGLPGWSSYMISTIVNLLKISLPINKSAFGRGRINATPLTPLTLSLRLLTRLLTETNQVHTVKVWTLGFASALSSSQCANSFNVLLSSIPCSVVPLSRVLFLLRNLGAYVFYNIRRVGFSQSVDLT